MYNNSLCFLYMEGKMVNEKYSLDDIKKILDERNIEERSFSSGELYKLTQDTKENVNNFFDEFDKMRISVLGEKFSETKGE